VRILATLLLFTATIALAQSPAPNPDTLYIHGDILTGSHLKPNDPSPIAARVTAVAIAQGKILAIGSDAEILKLKSLQTKVIDLEGAFAMPGFNDAHTHIASAGHQKLTVDLDGTTSLADMQQRIAEFAATASPNTWLEGGGWDHTKWASKTLPTRTDLDKVTGPHPAMFYRTDGHIVVANSAALALAKITSETPAPPGGQIDHDAKGAPTGIVRETPAVALLTAVIPPPTPEARRRALEIAIADALSHGVTSVQDYSDWEDFQILLGLEKEDKLHLRVSEWMDFNLPLKTLEERRASHDPNDPLLHLGMLKGFMDGSLGSRTAALAAPYADDPKNSGIPRYQQDKLNQMTSERAADGFSPGGNFVASTGFQLGFHAIGDEANTIALNAFAAAENATVGNTQKFRQPDDCAACTITLSAADLRLRIEHAQVLLPGDFDRFAKLASSPPCSPRTSSPTWHGPPRASVPNAQNTPTPGVRCSTITSPSPSAPTTPSNPSTRSGVSMPQSRG
jgi:predicted amidohydrolase YtcJ